MRTDRIVKRNIERARKATMKRTGPLLQEAFNAGCQAGIDYFKNKLQSSTANLTYEAN